MQSFNNLYFLKNFRHPKKQKKTTIITSIDKMNDAMIFTYDVHTSVITQYVLPGCAKPGVVGQDQALDHQALDNQALDNQALDQASDHQAFRPGFGPGFSLGLGVASGSPRPRK